ncbi:hypothetical protein BHE74_00055536 [Ensete ventricosum]|nr:hypothetical protein BHE74_00055536 [Ensete ventricosum]
MSGLPVDLGGSTARTPGYGRFTRWPSMGPPPKVPRFLGMNSSTAQPGRSVVKADSLERRGIRSEYSSDDVVGSHRKFTRRFAKGIGKLARNAKGDRRKEDQRTCRKIAGGCRSMQELGLN